jgi:DNA-binding MarR family transcriptional regulator
MPEARPKKTSRISEAADRIHSAAIRLLRAARGQDSLSGLSAARLSALSVVVFRGPLSLKALAEAEQVRPPTMTRIVQALVEARLVRRLESPQDARVSRITATARGRAVLKRGRERRVAFLGDRFSGLTRRELATLLEAARIIEKSVAAAPRPGS